MLTKFVLSALVLWQASVSARSGSGIWYSTRGQGPDVVLIHGANLDSRSWGALVDALAASHRVTTLDLRSHGRSVDATGPFSWIGDVVSVLDAIDAREATLIGHSLGAQIAIDVALSHPERVTNLVLVAPAVGGMPPTRPPEGLQSLAAAVRAGDMEQAGITLSGMPVMTLFADTTRQALVRSIVRANVRLFRVNREWLQTPDPPAAERLESLGVPTLVLLGAADPTESSLAGSALTSRVPRAAAESLPRCGHLIPLDCGEPATRSILAFLEQRPAGKRPM